MTLSRYSPSLFDKWKSAGFKEICMPFENHGSNAIFSWL